ncbi:MAG: DUF4173 domain-containing protein [Syntrophomonadaceae bacterium]|nr:DUF4173 domain-containing protein [Syntrophomonadaceae bacterium]
MEKTMRNKLLLYALISAVGLVLLVMTDHAGISVPLFFVLQFACWYWLAPEKKALWLFVPIFIISLNSFISASPIWQGSNVLVIIALYSVMVLVMIDRFPIKEDSLRFIFETIVNVFKPIQYALLPFKWWSEVDEDKTRMVKRVLKGIAVTVPCLFILIVMLSSADLVFLKGTATFINNLGNLLDSEMVFKAIFGAIGGLYLFGFMYIACTPPQQEEQQPAATASSADLAILNALLISILTVYTLFVFIQFRYLFAGAELPYGLSYAEYARRGFFELLFLSGFNIMLILISVRLTRLREGLGPKIAGYLCHYLCVVTIILLTSSFYRLWLYSADFGLTRLRLLVFGFLIFEAVGLLITFLYIQKPKFNIVAVYLSIGLLYYLILNIVPIDNLIAKNQVDRYFADRKQGIEYIMTLSPDAAPQISRLLDSGKVDDQTRQMARTYFSDLNARYSVGERGWQGYNLSIERAARIRY